MNFEIENVQWLLKRLNITGDRNLLIDIEEQQPTGKVTGYDLVIYDATDVEYDLVSVFELQMYCFEEELDETDFEVDRVTLVKGSL